MSVSDLVEQLRVGIPGLGDFSLLCAYEDFLKARGHVLFAPYSDENYVWSPAALDPENIKLFVVSHKLDGP